jgi:hypothetical protein
LTTAYGFLDPFSHRLPAFFMHKIHFSSDLKFYRNAFPLRKFSASFLIFRFLMKAHREHRQRAKVPHTFSSFGKNFISLFFRVGFQ